MRPLILTVPKNGVTRVTRVTNLINPLKILGFFSVTRRRSLPYLLCNADKPCNGHETISARQAMAFGCAPRWFDDPLLGRGAA
jgi:hypothetical protein